MTCSKTHRNNRLTIRVSRDWDQVCHLILSEFSHLETSRSGDPGSEKRAQQKDWTVPSSATYLYKHYTFYTFIVQCVHSAYLYIYNIQMHVKYTQVSANSEIQWDLFRCHPKNPRDGRPGIPMAAAGGGPKISSTSWGESQEFQGDTWWFCPPKNHGTNRWGFGS